MNNLLNSTSQLNRGGYTQRDLGLRRIFFYGLLGLFVPAICAADVSVPTTDLLLWLKADRGIRIENGVITGWQDSSGSGNHAKRDATFSTAAGNPAQIPASTSGPLVLRFDGSDAAFIFPILKHIQTVFWVVAKDPQSFGQHNERFVLGESDGKDFHVGTHKTSFILHPSNSSEALRKGLVRVNGRIVNPVTEDFPAQLSIISMVATGGVSANQISKDRQFKGRSWQGDLAEIILYSRALSDDERDLVENALSKKYNISFSAPTIQKPGTDTGQK